MNIQVEIEGKEKLIPLLKECCEKVGIKRFEDGNVRKDDFYFGVYFYNNAPCCCLVEKASHFGQQATVVSLEEFLMKVVSYRKPIEVPLNDIYTAIVSQSGIQVCSQKFPLDVIQKLAEARDKILSHG